MRNELVTWGTVLLVGMICVDPLSMAEATEFCFQQDVNGYDGTKDTYLAEWEPGISHGSEDSVVIHSGGGKHGQGLIRFNDIIGNEPYQVPPNWKDNPFLEATLTLYISNAGVIGANLHRMVQSWDESDTWNDWSDGIQPNNNEATSIVDVTVPTGEPEAGELEINVTDSVKAWLNGDDNYGWVLLPIGTGEDGWHFRSREWAVNAQWPKLCVTPEPTTLSLLALGGLVAMRSGLRRRR